MRDEVSELAARLYLEQGSTTVVANTKRNCYTAGMDEGHKRVLLIAASILAARKLANWDGRPSPALESALADAITIAERIMARIDNRWPAKERV